nr:MAG TPA: hypothetical protein [Caudoviricetes sp.]
MDKYARHFCKFIMFLFSYNLQSIENSTGFFNLKQ